MTRLEEEIAEYNRTDEGFGVFVQRVVREALLEAAGICAAEARRSEPNIERAAERIRALAGGEETVRPPCGGLTGAMEERVRQLANEAIISAAPSLRAMVRDELHGKLNNPLMRRDDVLAALSNLTIRSEAARSGDDGGGKD